MIEQALFAHLTADPALAALVALRIYPEILPQNSAMPAITYQRVSTLIYNTRDGGEFQRPRFQFGAYASTPLAAVQLAEALAAALVAFRLSEAPRVDVTLIEGRSQTYDPDTKLYRQTLDAFVWHATI